MASTSPSESRTGRRVGGRNEQHELWYTCACDPALTISYATKHTKNKVCWRVFYEPPPKEAALWTQSTMFFVPLSSELFVATSRMIKLYCSGICGIA